MGRREVEEEMRKRTRKGFTLVEIMIVVAIIALLAAIAIPNLLRARISANESAAIASLKSLSTACESFRAAQTPTAYPANLNALTNPAAGPPYIDGRYNDALGAPTVQGYTFTYTRVSNNEYDCVANPSAANVTGVRNFVINEEGVVAEDANANNTFDGAAGGDSILE